MRTAKTTRELCDLVCRSSTASESEKMLASEYRQLHDAARVALVTLRIYAEGLAKDGATQQVIDELECQLNS